MLRHLPSRPLFPPGFLCVPALGKPLTRWRYNGPLKKFRGLTPQFGENSEGPEPPGPQFKVRTELRARLHSQKPYTTPLSPIRSVLLDPFCLPRNIRT